jgi:hypothetical protein
VGEPPARLKAPHDSTRSITWREPRASSPCRCRAPRMPRLRPAAAGKRKKAKFQGDITLHLYSDAFCYDSGSESAGFGDGRLDGHHVSRRRFRRLSGRRPWLACRCDAAATWPVHRPADPYRRRRLLPQRRIVLCWTADATDVVRPQAHRRHAFLQRKRLCDIHSALRHADPATTTIAEIALQHGFLNLGRFSGYYRALFDEYPSETFGKRYPGRDRQRLAEPAATSSAALPASRPASSPRRDYARC